MVPLMACRFRPIDGPLRKAAGLTDREIAEFVDDDEIVAQQILGQATAAAGGLFLLELVDQIDQVEEAPKRPATYRKRAA
jgi:hypothetical protein